MKPQELILFVVLWAWAIYVMTQPRKKIAPGAKTKKKITAGPPPRGIKVVKPGKVPFIEKILPSVVKSNDAFTIIADNAYEFLLIDKRKASPWPQKFVTPNELETFAMANPGVFVLVPGKPGNPVVEAILSTANAEFRTRDYDHV